jgi:hypothetical protein
MTINMKFIFILDQLWLELSITRFLLTVAKYDTHFGICWFFCLTKVMFRWLNWPLLV